MLKDTIYLSKNYDLGSHTCFRFRNARMRLSFNTPHLVYLMLPRAKNGRSVTSILYSTAEHNFDEIMSRRLKMRPFNPLLLVRR